LSVTGICTDGMTIARYFGPALAGAIHLFRTVIDFATNRTLQGRCIDESRVWMGVRGSGADLVIWAVNRFMHELPEGVEVVNLVHDEVDAIVTRETLKATVDVVARAFQETRVEIDELVVRKLRVTEDLSTPDRSVTFLPEGTMVYEETFVQRDQHRIYVRDHPGAEPNDRCDARIPGQLAPLRSSAPSPLAAAPGRGI
jgi:hypothetical protein